MALRTLFFGLITIAIMTLCLGIIILRSRRDTDYFPNQLDRSQTRTVANLTKRGVLKLGQLYTPSTLGLHSIKLHPSIKRRLYDMRWIRCTLKGSKYVVEFGNSSGESFAETFDESLLDGLVDER
jgi:hypothetical protein